MLTAYLTRRAVVLPFLTPDRSCPNRFAQYVSMFAWQAGLNRKGKEEIHLCDLCASAVKNTKCSRKYVTVITR